MGRIAHTLVKAGIVTGTIGALIATGPTGVAQAAPVAPATASVQAPIAAGMSLTAVNAGHWVTKKSVKKVRSCKVVKRKVRGKIRRVTRCRTVTRTTITRTFVRDVPLKGAAVTNAGDVQQVARAINGLRTARGLRPLAFRSGSCQTLAARKLASTNTFQHLGCDNILARIGSFSQLGPAWQASAPHYRIIQQANSTGYVGVARDNRGGILVSVDFGM